MVGIDGYRGGWVAAVAAAGEVSWMTAPVDGIGALLAHLPSAGCVIAIDMPMGLPERDRRLCDALAKAALGRAHARVFLTPPRPVLLLPRATPNDEVQALSRELTGAGVSRQALALAPRILALDAHARDPRLVEAHPELSFAALAGEVLASKHSPLGRAQREAALGLAWPTGDVAGWLGCRPATVPEVDALDALVLTWTAGRHWSGISVRRPEDPPRDKQGVAMAIVT